MVYETGGHILLTCAITPQYFMMELEMVYHRWASDFTLQSWIIASHMVRSAFAQETKHTHFAKHRALLSHAYKIRRYDLLCIAQQLLFHHRVPDHHFIIETTRSRTKCSMAFEEHLPGMVAAKDGVDRKAEGVWLRTNLEWTVM